MILIICPRCRVATPRADDTWSEFPCRGCRRLVPIEEAERIHDRAAVRKFVLDQLRPVTEFQEMFALAYGFVGVLVCGFTALVVMSLTPSSGGVGWNEIVGLAVCGTIGAFFVLSAVLILAGARSARNGRRRLIAVLGGWLTLLSPSLVGFPIGVWVLMTLRRPEVKAVFDTPPT